VRKRGCVLGRPERSARQTCEYRLGSESARAAEVKDIGWNLSREAANVCFECVKKRRV
jgi:hypothetical protein